MSLLSAADSRPVHFVGIAGAGNDHLALLWALPVLVAKLAAGGLALAVIETILG